MHLPKKKLNTKSSTETELVGAAECLPKVSCLPLYVESQEFVLKRNLTLQDNQSVMLVEEN